MQVQASLSEFITIGERLWHAECISRLAITQASSRWLFCEPRRRLTTYPFVILSKLSPRYGDHARHGILHVSHNQGDEVPRRAPGTKPPDAGLGRRYGYNFGRDACPARLAGRK